MARRSGRMHVTAAVGVDLPEHERLLRFAPGKDRAAALGVWLVALLQSRRHEKDGYCIREWLGSFDVPEIVEGLVKSGLFKAPAKRAPAAVEVTNYAEFNETKAEIEARLKANRARVEQFRKAKKEKENARPSVECNALPSSPKSHVRTGVGEGEGDGEGISDPDPDLDHLAGGVAPTVPRARHPSTDDGLMGMACTAWSDGVQSVTKAAAPPRPGRWDQEAIAGVIRDHAPATRDERMGWAFRAGVAYAQARRGRTLSGVDFERWMSSGGYVPEAKRAPAVRPARAAEARGAAPAGNAEQLAALLRANTLSDEAFSEDVQRLVGGGR